MASTAQGSWVLGTLGERRRLLRGGDKTGEGEEEEEHEARPRCQRWWEERGSSLHKSGLPSSQRGSHRGIVGMAMGKCRPRAHPQHVDGGCLAESRSPQRGWIWVNVALAQRVPFNASWQPWEELTSHSESGGCQV